MSNSLNDTNHQNDMNDQNGMNDQNDMNHQNDMNYQNNMNDTADNDYSDFICSVLYAQFYMFKRMQKQSIKSMNLLSNQLSNHLFKLNLILLSTCMIFSAVEQFSSYSGTKI